MTMIFLMVPAPCPRVERDQADRRSGFGLQESSGLARRCRLGRWHRLELDSLECHIKAGPARRTRRPDVHDWLDRGRVVHVANAHNPALSPCIRLCKQVSAAIRTAFACDLVTAICRLSVFGNRAGNG